MRDVAAESDSRGVELARVGIKDLHLPVMIREKNGGMARLLGQVDASVSLPHYERGTHMSRFVEILNQWSRKVVSSADLEDVLRELRQAFGASRARVSLRFKYFLRKAAPVSGTVSQLDYDCEFAGDLSQGDYRFTLGVAVPVLTLCPCSKEISDRGAHNQRSHVTITVRTKSSVWIEEVVRVAEEQASSELYGLLKRPDEKFITEHAYDNPKFVEDMVRDVAAVLNADDRIEAYIVESENFESIHNHSAYALIERDKTKA